MTRAQYEAAKQELAKLGAVTEYDYHGDANLEAAATAETHCREADVGACLASCLELARTIDAMLQTYRVGDDWVVRLSIHLPREARDAA